MVHFGFTKHCGTKKNRTKQNHFILFSLFFNSFVTTPNATIGVYFQPIKVD